MALMVWTLDVLVKLMVELKTFILASIPLILVTSAVSKLKGWSNFLAWLNIFCILVTELVFKFTGEFNTKACSNICLIFSTNTVPSLPPHSMVWSNAWASLNIKYMLVTFLTSHLSGAEVIGWSKAVAPLNVSVISVTDEVSQLPMSWLNADALKNILVISVTSETSQLLMFWLNNSAFWNVSIIDVTLLVSQFDISSSKVVLPLNSWSISVICEVHTQLRSVGLIVEDPTVKLPVSSIEIIAALSTT